MRNKWLWLISTLLVVNSLTAFAGPTWKKGLAIPVVTEGSTCNSASDKIAVTSSNSMLSCQSGVWINAAGSGSAKAWVKFSGTGCAPLCAIQNAYNVSSVTGSGNSYTITFGRAMASSNYVATAIVMDNVNASTNVKVGAQSASQVLLTTQYMWYAVNPESIYLVVF